MVVGQKGTTAGAAGHEKVRPRSIKTKPAFKPHDFMPPRVHPIIDC